MGEVERAPKIRKVPQVHGLDRHCPVNQPGKTTLSARVGAVADDQNFGVARRINRGSCMPQRIVLPSIKLNPLDAGRGCSKVDRRSSRKIAPYRQQPVTEIVRPCIVPPPGDRELSYHRKKRDDLCLPICQGVAAKAEDRLERVSDDCRGQALGEPSYE